jgi:BlaI family penicillinase repressor
VEDGYHHIPYTTVMSALDRLFKKGIVARSEEGKAFRYTPRFSREELQRKAVAHAFLQLLDRDPGSSLPLSFLVEILGERDMELLDDLETLVEDKRREMGMRDPDREETK